MAQPVNGRCLGQCRRWYPENVEYTFFSFTFIGKKMCCVIGPGTTERRTRNKSIRAVSQTSMKTICLIESLQLWIPVSHPRGTVNGSEVALWDWMDSNVPTKSPKGAHRTHLETIVGIQQEYKAIQLNVDSRSFAIVGVHIEVSDFWL